MKRSVLIIGLTVLLLLLCSCGKAEEDAAVRVIDFSEYTAEEVLAWASENKAASSFRFVYTFDAQKDSGTVIAQSVESGKPIPEEGIEISIATKNLLSGNGSEVAIPNMIGKSYADAKTGLEALGLSVDSKYEDSTEGKDTVLLSDPLPGMSASVGSRVLLTLSSGERRDSRLSVPLDIPSTGQENNIIKVYVDGTLDRSKTVSLSASVLRKTFNFYGTGIQTVKFTVNNEFLAEYTLDFDKKTVKKVGE